MSGFVLGNNQTAQRVGRAVLDVEELRRKNPSYASTNTLWHVRITGGLTADGEYPGIAQTYDGVNQIWIEVGEVYVKPVYFEFYGLNDIVLCRFTGPSKDGSRGLYIPAPTPPTLITRRFVTKVSCVDNAIVYERTNGMAPLAAVMSVTVRRRLANGTFTLLSGRTVIGNCYQHDESQNRTTASNGVAVFHLGAGLWYFSVVLLTGEAVEKPPEFPSAPAYPQTYNAPEYTTASGAVGDAALTITIVGTGPTATVTPIDAPNGQFNIELTPPLGATGASQTTTITGPL